MARSSVLMLFSNQRLLANGPCPAKLFERCNICRKIPGFYTRESHVRHLRVRIEQEQSDLGGKQRTIGERAVHRCKRRRRMQA
jgi:hypothetical protein